MEERMDGQILDRYMMDGWMDIGLIYDRQTDGWMEKVRKENRKERMMNGWMKDG